MFHVLVNVSDYYIVYRKRRDAKDAKMAKSCVLILRFVL